MIPTGLELTAPALFVAGLAASPHCALMCGPLGAAQMQTRGRVSWREAQLIVNAGRVLGYAALGALAGGLGAVLLPQFQHAGVGRAVQAAAALLLIAGGLLQFGGRQRLPRACCVKPLARIAHWPPRLRLLLQGLAWAAMPCGILYGVLALAGFTGSALSGALLLAAFGLGTTPLLSVGGGVLGALAGLRGVRGLRWGAGTALILMGLFSGTVALGQAAPLLAWCSP